MNNTWKLWFGVLIIIAWSLLIIIPAEKDRFTEVIGILFIVMCSIDVYRAFMGEK